MAAIQTYLQTSGILHLSEEELAALEEPLLAEELATAISNAKTGKAPGQDGYSLLYYRTFTSLLTPHFLSAYNDAGTGAVFPADTLQAHITVIEKKGSDPLHCQNSRPISLLNADLKLFTKILTNSMLELIPKLIHSDQVGFVSMREARDNTIKAINLIHAAHVGKIPMLLLSTDVEKSFDRVNWVFLTETLKHIVLGQWMMHWIHAIYFCPSAQVKVNGHLSTSFGITNGTQQGCPLQ